MTHTFTYTVAWVLSTSAEDACCGGNDETVLGVFSSPELAREYAETLPAPTGEIVSMYPVAVDHPDTDAGEPITIADHRWPPAGSDLARALGGPR